MLAFFLLSLLCLFGGCFIDKKSGVYCMGAAVSGGLCFCSDWCVVLYICRILSRDVRTPRCSRDRHIYLSFLCMLEI